jgi:hypothetical protein
MSKRTSILKALIAKLNTIDGSSVGKVNLYNNCHSILKFWDEINQFPAVYGTTGAEQREYLPGDFKWAYLGISLKIYCKGEFSQDELEVLLEDIESVIDANRVLVYDTEKNLETTEILIVSITTDESLLRPYAVGEINLQVRYAL